LSNSDFYWLLAVLVLSSPLHCQKASGDKDEKMKSNKDSIHCILPTPSDTEEIYYFRIAMGQRSILLPTLDYSLSTLEFYVFLVHALIQVHFCLEVFYFSLITPLLLSQLTWERVIFENLRIAVLCKCNSNEPS
jgi:hypothetical protein